MPPILLSFALTDLACSTLLLEFADHVISQSSAIHAHLQAPFVMVESAGQAAAVYATSKATGRIGLDCEGVRLSRSGRVCLVQVCSSSAQSSTELSHQCN